MPPFVEQSDCSSSDSDNGHDEDPFPSFDSIPKNKRFALNVHGTYTNWGPREAFRELIQNWRDAIIESNKLAPRDLCVKREAKGEASGEASPPTGDTEIVYTAFRENAKDSAECLGFVRYKGRNGLGTIEITNLKAALQTKHLCLGNTSKESRDDQAGAHGEGLKLAALALMRSDQNHRVFCRTTGFNLSFNFDKDGCLYVDANRIVKARSTRKPKNIAFPTPAVNADGDVQFIIGERRQGQNEFGEKVKRSPVQQKDFKSWTKVALFLTEISGGDASIVSTPHGDLLTSDDLKGNLYLKGFLLSESTPAKSASFTGRPLGFGYNFASGKTNRERQSLANASEESMAICTILNDALKAREDLVGRVCDLLNSTEPKYAESESRARLWSPSTALLFKQHLLTASFSGRWLYANKEMEQNPYLVQKIEGMGREPFKLTDSLWDILSHHSLVHSCEKEAQRCYKNASTVTIPDTSFAASVNHLLQACIRACPQTIPMDLEFVDPGQVHLDLCLSKTKTVVRAHMRWLSLDAAVNVLGLVGGVAEADVATHAVKRLFYDLLEQVPRQLFLQQGCATLPDYNMKQERHRAEQRLANHRMTELRIVEKRQGGLLSLQVEWAVNSRQPEDDSVIEVQRHRVSSCSHLRDHLLIASDAVADKMACMHVNPDLQTWGCSWADRFREPPCGVHRTKLRQGTHFEPVHKEGEEYFFVLVTPAEPKSFPRVSNTKRVVGPSGGLSNFSSPIFSSPAKNNMNSFFSLGPRLESQEFLELSLAGDRLYKAENSQNIQAVIGFVKGEKTHPEESKKRRRLD